MLVRLGLVALMWILYAAELAADEFDRVTQPLLAGLPGTPMVQEVSALTPGLVTTHAGVVGDAGAAMVVVKTNGGNLAKVLVQFARQKTEKGAVPIVLLERLTTYKPGGERLLQSHTRPVHLYPGFEFSADLGQVVPAAVGGDVRHAPGPTPDSEGTLVPVGNAKLYVVVAKPVVAGAAPKPTRAVLGEAFDAKAISGVYQLHDDGRRQAKLTLNVDDQGQISGTYESEQTGRKYEVTGRVLAARHQCEFTVQFPNSRQVFTAWAFTRDAAALAGVSKTQEREFGFYATRVVGE
jgi:hypothetical protein